MTEKEVLIATDEWISWLKRLYTCTSDENKKQTQKHIELLEKLRTQAERVQEWRDIAKWQNDEKLKMEKIALEYEKQNKRYRKAINNIIEKAMLYGVDEEVYEAIQEAIITLEGEE